MIKKKIVAIIPSRMDSKRLPGKPLLKFFNIELIEHVRRRALLCKYFDDVYVATCDKEIANVVKKYNGKVIMTSKNHVDCNERILEASKKITSSHIVNVQGDEILVLPKNLNKICKYILKDNNSSYWNAVSSIENKKELINDSIVKCYISKNNNIIFCSRKESIINNIYTNMPVMKLSGLQVFKKKSLNLYKKNKMTPLEKKFSIGQMRIIENNQILKSIKIDKGYRGIDKKIDIKYAINTFNIDFEQKKVLQKIIY
jgi:3-deoxy-manno-octulosonate cytidylyltransferase (CMP-KDO synthetase)